MQADILLTTLNARYIHAAFGLRYLKANLHELEDKTEILEFSIDQRPLDLVEKLLAFKPKIIGLGVYIWNVEQCLQTAALIKKIKPEITLILGGPEVSYEQSAQPICALADYVLSGSAEFEFYALCKSLLNQEPSQQLGQKLDPKLGQPPNDLIPSVNQAPKQSLADLKMPYYLYTDEDIAHRILYVEASRGCPFKCTFCLSSLDKTAKPFDLTRFLDEMKKLYDRGARQFKFVDRTFNLSIKVSVPIMEFFLERMDEDLFVHFEVIPDRLPEALKNTIKKFPLGSLQFEVGVQTFNPEIQHIIQRKQDNAQSKINLAWLCQTSPAHIHTDLIFGLPGESLESMAQSFDTLVALGPDEIQLGILKRLRGMPMRDKETEYKLIFNPNPPYDILSTRDIDFETMQKLRRMARYWDLIANAGRLKNSLILVLADAPFERFMQLSEWLHFTTGQTHKISLKRLFDLVFEALCHHFKISAETALKSIRKDFINSGQKRLPQCLLKPAKNVSPAPAKKASPDKTLKQNKRQKIHHSASNNAHAKSSRLGETVTGGFTPGANKATR